MQKKNAEDAKKRAEKAALDKEAMEKALNDQMSNVQGKLGIMLNDLVENKTPFEYTLAGIDLGNIRCKIFA